ncbi:ROK family protein [Streptomyces sp. NBC_00842]|uniref:ROK family protein n=1 Tax=Streptomyces sp. NBC_00842 TaxID=2975848 RepID=UPI0038650E2F|nr:ROK family protein [Streptomyces sp. NBC_00842]
MVGSRGYGGEVGHVTVHPDGPLCGCGRRGCWEAFVGLNALQGYFRSDTDGSPVSAAQAVDSSTGVGGGGPCGPVAGHREADGGVLERGGLLSSVCVVVRWLWSRA